MAEHTLRYDINLSMLFTELPLPKRPEAARAAGFTAVEFWWPFTEAVPSDAEVGAFVTAVDDAGVALAGLNFFAGDMPGGDRGLVSWPGRESELADSADVAIDIARRLGCRTFNALYGNRIDGLDPAAQDETALANLDLLAGKAAAIGAKLVLEPLSGADRYPLRTAADALAVMDKLGRPELTLLADLYHLATNGDDLAAVIAEHTARIGHVQFADVPGRHEPGSGELDIDGYLGALQEAGYTGYAGLEYQPTTGSEASLSWLPRARRAAV
ncbi:hydroxypyruvate isomerase [Prauserella marina]|uniref:Hydroxypyruvate isomerase n=1 Tax=Prauserella marina TaxID=530584 RepID=A0A222VLE0_9PSEU|nr:TIM barrel protein [Prauserella marina]ASR34739.1 hydroxypyruvate isomerase [Prauserella marina]PWV85591.1 hydroxypyruvate isomerase [Prauserella marina]SDC51072.1 hydroxypyruvate isomerase [Prauserella marina]